MESLSSHVARETSAAIARDFAYIAVPRVSSESELHNVDNVLYVVKKSLVYRVSVRDPLTLTLQKLFTNAT